MKFSRIAFIVMNQTSCGLALKFETAQDKFDFFADFEGDESFSPAYKNILPLANKHIILLYPIKFESKSLKKFITPEAYTNFIEFFKRTYPEAYDYESISRECLVLESPSTDTDPQPTVTATWNTPLTFSSTKPKVAQVDKDTDSFHAEEQTVLESGYWSCNII